MLKPLRIAPDRAFSYVPAMDEAVDLDGQAALVEDDGLDHAARVGAAWRKYIETRDEKWLALRPGVEPTRIGLMPLSEKQLRDVSGESSDVDQRALACAYGVRSVANLQVERDGGLVNVRVERTADGRVKQSVLEDLGPRLVQEVGLVVLFISRQADRF